ncbi:MAG: hypothetical protein ABFR89_09475 [Actinomycetota bacterium]
MGTFRSIVDWTTDDYEGVVDLARRMTDYVGANEPDALAFEWFGDQATGHVVWYQVYRDEEAFLDHAQKMKEEGFRDEALQLLSLDRIVSLTPVTHPQLQNMAQQQGVVELRDIAGVVR